MNAKAFQAKTGMKKRDFYILAFLSCLVIYAMLHRHSYAENQPAKIEQAMKKSTDTESLSAFKKDTIRSEKTAVNRAGI